MKITNVTGQKAQCALLPTFPIFPVPFCWGRGFAQRPLSCVLVDEVDAQAAALPCH